MSRKTSALRRGFLQALPIVVGVLPFGIAYGAAVAQNMPWWGGMGMSALVFAGSAQFIAVGLIAQGATPLSIIITTALVNLRFVLMSSALSPVLRKKGPRWQPLLAFFVVDESFAVSSVEFERGKSDAMFFLGSGLALYFIWQLSTAAGIWFGPLIPEGLGLEFALSASFIGPAGSLDSISPGGPGWTASRHPVPGAILRTTRDVGPLDRRSHRGDDWSDVGTTETWGLILGMALVTYLIRYLPLACLSQAEIPSWFARWLELATAAILAAMLAPTVLIVKDRIDLSLSNANFWAAIPAALVAWRTRNIMLTILVGMAASAVIQQTV